MYSISVVKYKRTRLINDLQYRIFDFVHRGTYARKTEVRISIFEINTPIIKASKLDGVDVSRP